MYEVEIDDKNNVNVTVKESYLKGEVAPTVITRPIFELELSQKPRSITIRDEDGDKYEEKTM